MDFESCDEDSEPPSKRPCFKRSSTPIRDLPPAPCGANLDSSVLAGEEAIAPARDDHSPPDMSGQGELSPEEHDPGPDYFGLSREDMGKYESVIVAYVIKL